MPLNADQLDAFWHVVQAGGYHAAAEQLFISQSAVTQRIQALETELGTRLFMRAGRGVVLTEAGHVLVRHCKEQREAEGVLLQRLQGDGDRLVGRLAVAAGSAEGRLRLLPAIAALLHEHPDLEVAVTLDDRLDPVAALESCQVDAVLGETPLRRRGLRSVVLGRTSYGLVASPRVAAGWPDVPPAEVLLAARAIDFEPRDRITLDHLALCLPGVELGGLRRHFVNDTQGILDLTLAGAGFAVLPLALVAPHVESGALRPFYPAVVGQRTLYWTVPDGTPPAPVQALKQSLNRVVAS